MAFHPWKLKGLDLNPNFTSEWGEFCLCVCVYVFSVRPTSGPTLVSGRVQRERGGFGTIQGWSGVENSDTTVVTSMLVLWHTESDLELGFGSSGFGGSSLACQYRSPFDMAPV